MSKDPKNPYLKRLLGFYFAPVWPSLFAIFYLVFFSYFAIFYSYNLILALKFILHTFDISSNLLGLPYLFWGVIFLISLIIPFSISIYSIALPYEVSSKSWSPHVKALVITLFAVGAVAVVVAMDEIIRIVGNQVPIIDFAIKNDLHIISR
jgi:hypothetical protein